MRSRLKVLRAERGWTQADLGERVGVSRQAIIAIESDKHDPSLDLAFRIAAAFGLAVEAVFENPHTT
ncbi:helix-turn-helix transcriptional regulator [Brevundimonas sp. 2R-24]|uniref:Helix-turn-helix transcriptional regulator n=1 Tax=Peiella sedimenti TaxID=3061083 RepID=A0ABT8SH62_9CAUL|nr:helix-turn-helix transcriptional regulator [Caulobacteraceae bacterium XZ-24]